MQGGAQKRSTGYKTYLLLLSLHFLRVSSQAVSVKVKEVRNVVGSEVTMQCDIRSQRGVENLIIDWSRGDLAPAIVHLYRDGKDDLEGNQNPRYAGRTALDKALLKTGSVALTLRDLRLTDIGNYTCNLRDGGRLSRGEVELLVYESTTGWEAAVAVLGVGLGVALTAIGLLVMKLKATKRGH